MSYTVYVNRSDEQPIGLEEWQAYIAAHPGLFEPRTDDEVASDTVRLVGIEEDWNPDLYWGGGNVYANYPSALLLEFMIRIAGDLGAFVTGDEGERYIIAFDEKYGKERIHRIES